MSEVNEELNEFVGREIFGKLYRTAFKYDSEISRKTHSAIWLNSKRWRSNDSARWCHTWLEICIIANEILSE